MSETPQVDPTPEAGKRTAWIMLLLISLVVLGYTAVLLIGGRALKDAPLSGAVERLKKGITGFTEPPQTLRGPQALSPRNLVPTSSPTPIAPRVTPSPTLSPKVIPPEPTDPSLLTFTIAFENTTGVRLTEVKITDKIPAGTTYRQGSASSGGIFDGTQVSWNIGTLDPGASGKVSFQVFTRLKGRITNEAVLTSKEAPPSSIKSSATVS